MLCTKINLEQKTAEWRRSLKNQYSSQTGVYAGTIPEILKKYRSPVIL